MNIQITSVHFDSIQKENLRMHMIIVAVIGCMINGCSTHKLVSVTIQTATLIRGVTRLQSLNGNSSSEDGIRSVEKPF